MIHVFNQPPKGVQIAPHDPRMLAIGHRVAMRQIDFTQVYDKNTLMLAALSGLGLSQTFARDWDALTDVLGASSPFPPKFALLLGDYADFRRRRPKLAAELERSLLAAQAAAAERGHALWLLSEEAESDPRAW